MSGVDVIRLVTGDDRPVIILTLTDDVSGAPIDLSPSPTVVSVRFREAGSTDEPTIIPCNKINGGGTGQVQFDFSGGVLDVPAGMYEGEIVVNFGGPTHTVYDTLRFRIRESFSG